MKQKKDIKTKEDINEKEFFEPRNAPDEIDLQVKSSYIEKLLAEELVKSRSNHYLLLKVIYFILGLAIGFIGTYTTSYFVFKFFTNLSAWMLILMLFLNFLIALVPSGAIYELIHISIHRLESTNEDEMEKKEAIISDIKTIVTWMHINSGYFWGGIIAISYLLYCSPAPPFRVISVGVSSLALSRNIVLIPIIIWYFSISDEEE